MVETHNVDFADENVDGQKIVFFDGSEFIEGEAEIIEIDSERLVLSKNVSVIKSGNKINSEKMVVKLKKNDKS